MREPIVEPPQNLANPSDSQDKPAEDEPRMEASAPDEGEERAPAAYDYDDLGESYDATD